MACSRKPLDYRNTETEWSDKVSLPAVHPFFNSSSGEKVTRAKEAKQKGTFFIKFLLFFSPRQSLLHVVVNSRFMISFEIRDGLSFVSIKCHTHEMNDYSFSFYF